MVADREGGYGVMLRTPLKLTESHSFQNEAMDGAPKFGLASGLR